MILLNFLDLWPGLLAKPLGDMPREKQLVALQDLEAAIRDCTDLHDLAILIEAYNPSFVYWETLGSSPSFP